MSKNQMPEEVKLKAVKNEPTFGDMFDFNNMWRVKGKKGLVSIVHHTSGHQMAIVCDIYKKNRRSVSVSRMVQLSTYKFKVNNSFTADVGMKDVFNNLMNYATTSEDYGFERISIKELMPLMVPNYDESFKEYRAKELLGIYIEVTLKYSALIDQKVEAGEVELLTEEKE